MGQFKVIVDIQSDGGRALDRRLRPVAVAAVLSNPYAGGWSEDLSELSNEGGTPDSVTTQGATGRPEDELRSRGRDPVPARLDDVSLRAAADSLSAADPELGSVIDRAGYPPLWAREPGFPTLVHLILEQQVSLASARAAFERLQAAARPLSPEGLLELDDGQLLAIGFSRQKARYARALAAAVSDGTLDLPALAALDDEAVDAALTVIPGIGPWTATIYRLMVLLRPDAWPVHDMALAQSISELYGLSARPGAGEMLELAESWRPWRAVAARILWHHYLSTDRARRVAS